MITFFGVTYVVSPPPTVYLVSLFALASAITPPLAWRRSAYSLYLSALLAVLSLAMLIDTMLFQQRYLQVRDFVVIPTPNGYAYVELPPRITSMGGVPVYVLLIAVVISMVNMLTRARWLGLRGGWSLAHAVREYGGALTAIKQALDRLDIPYRETEYGIVVGDLAIRPMGDKVVLSLEHPAVLRFQVVSRLVPRRRSCSQYMKPLGRCLGA